MLEWLSEGNANLLLNAIDLAARKEFVPEQWSHGRITVIPKVKPGKEIDLKNQNNYRPITVTSCMMRIFEGILLGRLEKRMTKKLSDVQGGFVRGRGTMEQLFAVREICRRKRRRKKTLALAFLDLKKAFDLVWHEGLLFKLWTRFGIRGKLWRLVKLLLESNYVRVEIGDTKTGFSKLDAGTRQGGKSSPLLFNIFIDDVVEKLDATNCGVEIGELIVTCLLYADDIVLFAESPQELQTLLETAESWAKEWRLVFNGSKCKILVIYADRAMSQKFKNTVFTLFDEHLELVRVWDYLGMEMRANLSLSGTPARLRVKVEKRVNFLRWMAANKNGLRASVFLPLFRTVVRPVLTTNGQLARYTRSRLANIETTQAMGLKRCLKMPMYLKHASLRILTGVPPVEATLDTLYLTFWYKMSSSTIPYLEALVRESELEARAELQLGYESGDGWYSTALGLVRYGCSELWDSECGKETFRNRISSKILAYYAKMMLKV